MADKIKLLQFLICERFQAQKRDGYLIEGVRSNLYVPSFPHRLDYLYVVTCWRKDDRFHKEVIEYADEKGQSVRSAHMDIEPRKGNVIFRWHTHRFPGKLVIEKTTTLWVRVILDWELFFESYLLIEKDPAS